MSRAVQEKFPTTTNGGDSEKLDGIEQIDSELSCLLHCPICFEIFTDPRSLDCGHVFCFSCLRHMMDSTFVNCPACYRRCDFRKMTRIFLVKDFVEYHKRSIDASRHRCENCAKTANIDDLWTCCECKQQMLCSKCLVAKRELKCGHAPEQVDQLLQIHHLNAEDWLEIKGQKLVNHLTMKWDDTSASLRDLHQDTEKFDQLFRKELMEKGAGDTINKCKSEIEALKKRLNRLHSNRNDPELLQHLKSWDETTTTLETDIGDIMTTMDEWRLRFVRVSEILRRSTAEIESAMTDQVPSEELQKLQKSLSVTSLVAEFSINDLPEILCSTTQSENDSLIAF